MAVVHSGIPAILNNSREFSSDSLADSTTSRIDHDGQSRVSAGTKMEDLPEEVLTMIFMELDSVTRKKIKSVCRNWCRILQGVKILRTHVKLESLDVRQKGLENLLRNYVMSTPEVEVLHLDGPGNPADPAGWWGAVDLEFHVLFAQDRGTLRKGMSIRNAVLFLTNGMFVIPMDVRRMNFFNEDTTKWFKELILNLVDDPYQLINIYLNDSGPLTELDNLILNGGCAGYRDFFNSFGSSFASLLRLGVNMDLRGLLEDMVAGRSIPKFIANMLVQFTSRNARL